MFSRMIIMAKQNPTKYGMNDKIVKKIEKESKKYVQSILSGRLFITYMD